MSPHFSFTTTAPFPSSISRSGATWTEGSLSRKAIVQRQIARPVAHAKL